MKIEAFNGSVRYGEPGVFRGLARFENPTLKGHLWPLFEVRGAKKGPRLCISAGVHVNEVSSIEASILLQAQLDPEEVAGSISIMPVVNQPALYRYCEYVCPVDNKNINFTFPGDPLGTFSEALSDAIQNDWCLGADCYIDMHGGDLREKVSKFSMFQRTGDAQFDRWAERLATCFDSDLVVGLPIEHMEGPGRPPTGFACQHRVSIMSESGANGLLDGDSIAFHLEGALNVARELGILASSPTTHARAGVVCDDYLWVTCPADGMFYADVEPGRPVGHGQSLGEVRDYFGRLVARIESPADGYLLWRMTQPNLKKGAPALAVAVPQKAASARWP